MSHAKSYKKPAGRKPLVLLGPEGSFSSIAAKRFSDRYTFIFVDTFGKVLKKLECGPCDALLPIRNKIFGPIDVVVEALKGNEFFVVKKFKIKISFVLAAPMKLVISDINALFVSKIALTQCSKWVEKFIPQAKAHTNIDSTSEAFKKIVQLRKEKAAAIGSLAAVKLYNFTVLAKNIQDEKDDWTEFVLISKARLTKKIARIHPLRQI